MFCRAMDSVRAKIKFEWFMISKKYDSSKPEDRERMKQLSGFPIKQQNM